MADAPRDMEQAAERIGADVQGAARRGAAQAARQFDDLSKIGQQLAREANQRIEAYTGRASDEWIKAGTQFIKNRPWTAIALTAVAVYILNRRRA